MDIPASPKKENLGDPFHPQTAASSREGAFSKKAQPDGGHPSGSAASPAGFPSEGTRAIGDANHLRHTSTSQIAQETRVGNHADLRRAERERRAASYAQREEEAAKAEAMAYEMERKAEKRRIRKARFSLGSTLTVSLIYIAFVVAVSAVLSYYGINWANDIFALVKDEVVSTVTIPENATISEVAEILEDNGLIRYPAVFRFYIGYKNRDKALQFKPGEYELKSTLNYDQMVSVMKDRKTRSIVKITIPEGYTTDEIIHLFVSQGIGTREGFLYAINEFEYDYPFMERLMALELSPDRKYRLEGYLFPDTYEFYTDSKEVAIVDKMLAAFQYHFEEGYYARLDELGMNLDQIITLASIIQSEGKFAYDFAGISGVFHNRLRSKTLKKLQSDATIQYCLAERKEELTYEDLEVNHPYNTYKIEGLPPSAIANPGWEAITAAMYPQSNEYYYFVSDTDGSTVFAKTEPEHLINVAALRKAKENGTTID
ncbi:MAG: endolytic transglycosylase MltG [Clostridia bacterium]|nr:endolytic transglycosylase MltG [Clostridia bacterium]